MLAATHEESTMFAIRHHIGINAPQERVHQALATTAGVASWWTADAAGDAGEGAKLLLYFGGAEPRVVLEVVSVSADRIEWRGIDGPQEWIGTTFTFELGHADGETMVLFTHGGWRESEPFLAHCATKWAYFLLGLKAMLEGGEATPYPGDLHISSWG